MTGNKQEGFAIVYILIVIALIISILGETLDSIKVESKSTAITKSLVASEIALDSGVVFLDFVFKLNNKIKNSKSFADLKSVMPENLYDDIKSIPLGNKDAFSAFSVSELTDVFKGEAIDLIQFLDGFFVISEIIPESGKLNLNAIIKENDYNLREELMLRIFTSKLSEKLISIYSYTPQEIKNNIFSYITERNFQNQSAYKDIGASYSLKQGALQTLQELRRVPGFNYDDIYNVYKNYFTVWPMDAPSSQAITLKDASVPLVSAMLTPLNTTLNTELWRNIQDDPYLEGKLEDWFKEKSATLLDDSDSNNIVKKFMKEGDGNIRRVIIRGEKTGVKKTVQYIFEINSKGEMTPLHYIW